MLGIIIGIFTIAGVELLTLLYYRKRFIKREKQMDDLGKIYAQLVIVFDHLFKLQVRCGRSECEIENLKEVNAQWKAPKKKQ